jgi:hypothetical protein
MQRRERFEFNLGSQIKYSSLSAIRLISLRPFQTFLLDWPHLACGPGVDSNP